MRNEERAAPVKKAYPKVRIVLGGLEDASVIEKEAAAADIVIRMLPSVSSFSLQHISRKLSLTEERK